MISGVASMQGNWWRALGALSNIMILHLNVWPQWSTVDVVLRLILTRHFMMFDWDARSYLSTDLTTATVGSFIAATPTMVFVNIATVWRQANVSPQLDYYFFIIKIFPITSLMSLRNSDIFTQYICTSVSGWKVILAEWKMYFAKLIRLMLISTTLGNIQLSSASYVLHFY